MTWNCRIAGLLALGLSLSVTPINLAAPPDSDQRAGEDAEKHWAFRPEKRPPTPEAADPAWSLHPIDRFISARRAAEGAKPAPEADLAKSASVATATPPATADRPLGAR